MLPDTRGHLCFQALYVRAAPIGWLEWEVKDFLGVYFVGSSVLGSPNRFQPPTPGNMDSRFRCARPAELDQRYAACRLVREQ